MEVKTVPAGPFPQRRAPGSGNNTLSMGHAKNTHAKKPEAHVSEEACMRVFFESVYTRRTESQLMVGNYFESNSEATCSPRFCIILLTRREGCEKRGEACEYDGKKYVGKEGRAKCRD